MVILGNAAALAAMSAADQSSSVFRVDEGDHYHDDWVPPFDFRDEIGEGKFGKVYRCIEKATRLTLAAKSIRLKKDTDFQKVEKEVNIMTQMRHRCIAQIYDAFATSTNDVILIMEIVEGGELFERVAAENYILTETAVSMIVYQICEAIRYIHSQNIIHLDLKPENIMCVSQTGNQIKLIDFGLAQHFDGQRDLLFMAGTPEFAAPEVIKYEPLDFHTDMWSLGVITYILLSGVSPFLGDNVALTYCNVERGKYEFCEEFTENCISDEAKDFIQKLLVLDKHKRMLPDDCMKHPWIVQGREKAKRIRASSSSVSEDRKLDIGKFRSYYRNRKFRRLVFGVLFINSVARMMNTLKEKKSEHGIEYMKTLLSAVGDSNEGESSSGLGTSGAGNLMKNMFSKRRRNVTTSGGDKPGTSSGEELHAKAKRQNNNVSGEFKQKKQPVCEVKSDASTTSKSTTITLSVPTSSASEASSAEDNGTVEKSSSRSPTMKRRGEEKAKRAKSASRKASSTEQEAKKPKTTTSPVPQMLSETSKAVDKSEDTKANSDVVVKSAAIPQVKVIPAEPTVESKVKRLAKLADPNTAPFQLPVACAVPIKPKTSEIGPNKIITTTSSPASDSENKTTVKKVVKKIKKDAVEINTIPQKADLIPVGQQDILKTKIFSATSAKPATAILQARPMSSCTPKPTENNQKEEVRFQLPVASYVSRPTTPVNEVQDAKSKLKSTNRPKAPEHEESIERPKTSEHSKSGGLVGSLLKRLEQNADAPAMNMAVSGYVPPSRPITPIPQAVTKTEKVKKGHGSAEDISKIKERSEEEKQKRKRSPKTNNLVEKKTCVKSSVSKKESSAGGSGKVEKQTANSSTCEVKVCSSTTVDDIAKAKKSRERAEAVYAKSTITVEKDKQAKKINSEKREVFNISKEQSMEKCEKMDFKQNKVENGTPLSIGRLSLSEVDKSKLVVAGKMDSGKHSDVLGSALVAEKKKLRKAKVSLNGEEEIACEEVSRKLLISGGTTVKFTDMTSTHGPKEKSAVKKKDKTEKTTYRSLGNLSVSEPDSLLAKKNVTFSHNVLVSDGAEGSSLSRSNKPRTPIGQTIGERRPKSESDVSYGNKISSDDAPGGVAKHRDSKSLQSQTSVDESQDAFDFNQLRIRLQQRIMGVKDDDDLATEAENRKKTELRVQRVDTGNTQRAMKKWISLDKQAATNPLNFHLTEW
ncbi:protein kinase domain-containing protein [Ditylenchus destructor]|nr:protein kinase domain-containing protein [Ditylenchus destructor]